MHFILIALLQVPAATPAQKPDSLALARQYTAWFYTGQIDSLIAHHPTDARSDTTLRRRLVQQSEQVALRAGDETAVIEVGLQLAFHDADKASPS